jgi:LacI family repressor for deo operon, udp, cdd, tsx, nupC, and nupG
MAAKLHQIAAHAGVSPATASRVLNGRPGVAEATRRSVLAAVDVLGYQRPASLQTRRIGLIGVIIAELENPIFPLYAQAIERALPSFGYNALLSTRRLGAPAERGSIDLLQAHGVAGVIFVSGMHSDSRADTGHYYELREQGIPLAFINGLIPDFDATFVADDDATAMDLAVRHLLALGHRHIGLAIGATRYTPAARKLAGFHRAMQRRSPDAIPEVHIGDYSIEGGHAAAVDLIPRGCTAIIAGSDFLALGAIRGARSLGLQVPNDISVIGYDGAPIMAYTGPPLTTIKQAVDSLTGTAVRSLIEEIEGTPRPRTELLFQPELIVRSSTDAADSPSG